MAAADLGAELTLTPQARRRVRAVLAKADPAASVRGHRTTMCADSDLHATRHARASVGGLLAGVFGQTRLYVSGGAATACTDSTVYALDTKTLAWQSFAKATGAAPTPREGAIWLALHERLLLFGGCDFRGAKGASGPRNSFGARKSARNSARNSRRASR